MGWSSVVDYGTATVRHGLFLGPPASNSLPIPHLPSSPLCAPAPPPCTPHPPPHQVCLPIVMHRHDGGGGADALGGHGVPPVRQAGVAETAGVLLAAMTDMGSRVARVFVCVCVCHLKTSAATCTQQGHGLQWSVRLRG